MSISPICRESSCSGASSLEAYRKTTNPFTQKETQKTDGAVISERAKELAAQRSGTTIDEELKESPTEEAKEGQTELAA